MADHVHKASDLGLPLYALGLLMTSAPFRMAGAEDQPSGPESEIPFFHEQNLLVVSTLLLLLGTFIIIWRYRAGLEARCRQETEKALSETNRRLSLSLRGGDLGTWDWNMPSGLLEVNERWLTMLGYEPDELNIDVARWEELVYPEDLKNAYSRIKAHLSGQVEYYEAEFRMRMASGGLKWVRARGQLVSRDKNGQPLRMAGVHQDISELKKTSGALQAANRALQSQVDIVDQYVITSSTDIGGTITYASKAFCNISGYGYKELLGKNHRILRHPEMPASLYDDLWSTISSGRTWEGEIKNRRKDGGFYWVHAYISPVWAEDHSIIGYNAIRLDITDRKKVEAISITDELTGLYNRRHFNEAFPIELARATRNQKIFTLMIMDVDYFKKYNDSLGHQKGDMALMHIGAGLKNKLKRCEDLAFRLGGEEFAGVFVVSKEQDAYTIAEDIRTGIESLLLTHPMNEASPYVTVSIGVYTVIPEEKSIPDMNEIYRLADEALYRAKEAGRNRVY